MMKMTTTKMPAPWLTMLGLLLALAWPAHAQPAPEVEANAAAAEPSPLTVAVLDFDTSEIAIEDLGSIISQTVTIMLAGDGHFRLVDRASLERTLEEHELNLTGLVDTAEAVQVGRLVGARILVVGRAFQLGQRTFITAKLIGTETSLVDGVLVQGDPGAAIDELVIDLAQQLATRLPEAGPRLVAQEGPIDPLPTLRAALAGRDLPSVAVVITEEHIARQRTMQPIPDPAAETEVKRLLQSAGVTIQDVPANALTTWARTVRSGQPEPWPRDLAAVDLVITGEAFSEFAAQIGNLQSAAARVEINVIDRRTGRIVRAERTTTRAVDLAENIAGKSALERGGRAMAIEILRYLAEHAPEAAEVEVEADVEEADEAEVDADGNAAADGDNAPDVEQ